MAAPGPSSGALVTVTGAAGLIGMAVVRHFLEKGYRVRALVHRSSVFPSHPALEVLQGDILDEAFMEQAIGGTDTVVHLAARKSDEKDSLEVNAGGARVLAKISAKAGVRRIMNISTQSVKLPVLGLYGESKAAADRELEQGNVPLTTLRLSLVYGDKSGGILGMLVSFTKLPVVPVIGDGKATFWPIHRDDATRAIERLAFSDAAAGKTYDAGGPDRWTFDDLLRECGRRTGKSRLWLVHIPIPIALLIAKAMRWMRNPPVTVSNVLGAAAVVPMDTSDFFRDIEFVPRSLATGLDTAFGEVSATETEAKALLRYVLPSARNGFPDDETMKRYNKALAIHGVTDHLIDEQVLRSRFLLGSLDAITRLLYPTCMLQRKLLVAAAVAESTPYSRDLLPRKRSLPGLLLSCLGAAASAGLKMIAGLILLTFSSFLRRNAGC